MSAWQDDTQISQKAFLRGTRRAELPIQEQSPSAQLGLLAAIASRARFKLPSYPDEFETTDNHSNPEHMASMPVRTALCRYFRSSRQADQPDCGVVRVFRAYSERGLHVHRFDYMQLKPLLSKDASLFDAPFRRWANGRKASDTDEHADITDKNWLEFSNPERYEYIRALHQEDAERARTLLTECLGQESASIRGKLLDAISLSITFDDKGFLESLLTDRAKSVKEAVATMLGNLSGTEQYQVRLDEAASRLSIKVSKLRKKKTLEVEQPGGYKAHRLAQWYHHTFTSINPVELAQHLDVSTKELCELITQKDLAFVCFSQLARQQEHAMMGLLASRHADEFLTWVRIGDLSGLESIDGTSKDALWDALLNHASMEKLAEWVYALEQLYLALKAPVPEKLSKALLNKKQFSKGVAAIVEEHAPHQFNLFEVLVAVLHPGAYPDLIERLDGVPSVYTVQVTQLINLINLLEVYQTSSQN